MIQALLDPRIYPHPVDEVELLQTHISFVLLAGEYVYKIKKPVDFGFLNFSTLARRRYYCQQEITLNSRLCPEIYLGIVPIVEDKGEYHLGGRGRIVEYAVKMARLPREGMMDYLLAENKVTKDMVEALADKLANFHERSATGPAIARQGSLRTVAFNWEENFKQTEANVGITISAKQYRYLQAYVSAFMQRHRSLFRKRIAEGHIRDCHGDLRAAAVCFTDDICVFDCIEFSRRFRYSDVASEVAFLAMDLDVNGHTELAQTFVDRYVKTSGDGDLLNLLDFYRCYRAYVRGKVEGFTLGQPEIDAETKDKTLDACKRYFALACDYASPSQPPLLLITCGLVGTGKSALANGIASKFDMDVISSDVVRKELAGIASQDHRYEPYQRGIYSRQFTQRTYKVMFDRGRELLRQGRSVILDATFSQKQQREQAHRLAGEAGALFFCVEAAADEATVRQRLEQRTHDPSAVSDAGWEVYEAQKATFEPVNEFDDWQQMILYTGWGIDRSINYAVEALDGRVLPTGVR